jgi:Fur family transcriptional regulator, ferric uptake regulator
MDTNLAKTARERLNLFLKQKGLKPTVERSAILDEALATEGHFEADDLLVILKKKGIKTSRATIYRTLELLYKSGFLRKVCLREAHIHFQKITDAPRHDHLICTRCGALYEFYLPALADFQKKLCAEHNFSMTDYCFQIFGLCRDCAGESK